MTDERTAAWLLAATTGLGFVFLALQAVVWTRLWNAGLTVDKGPYPSVFYGLTVIHALHVAVGLLALAWLTLRAFQGTFNAARHLPVRLWALYWHFVGAVWLLMFVSVYVI